MEKIFTESRRRALKLGGLMLCGLACQKNILKVPEDQLALQISLTEDLAAPLRQTGGFVFRNELFIMRLAADEFVIVSRWCTHAAGALQFNPLSQQLECPVHGSIFDLTGKVVQGPAQFPLRRYRYELRQDVLLIFT